MADSSSSGSFQIQHLFNGLIASVIPLCKSYCYQIDNVPFWDQYPFQEYSFNMFNLLIVQCAIVWAYVVR